MIGFIREWLKWRRAQRTQKGITTLPEVAYFEDSHGITTTLHSDDLRLAVEADLADDGQHHGRLSRAAKFGPYTAEGIRTIIKIAQDYGDDVEMALIAVVAHTTWGQDHKHDD